MSEEATTTTSRYIYEIYIGAPNPVYVYRTARGLQNRLDAIANDLAVAVCEVYAFADEGATTADDWSKHRIEFKRSRNSGGWQVSEGAKQIPGVVAK